MFYNIAKKQEVNPFDNLIGIAFTGSDFTTEACGKLRSHVHKNYTPKAEAIGERWFLIFPTKSLDFTTRITWFDNSTTRGKFTYSNGVIHFRIEENVMFLG